MKKILFIALLALWIQVLRGQNNTFWLGADISGTTEMEAHGVELYNAAGEPRENTALMKELGLNAVRLRVWVNPKHGFSSKEDVLVMAKRAQTLGMAIMIDFHYSDWWADPGKQNIPAQWKHMNYNQMCKALAKHTRETLALLKKNGIDVKWVQVGNETTNGFLWPMGEATTNMAQYAGLTQAGYEAVKQVYPDAIVIVHLDAGSDAARYNFIFDGLVKYGAKFDMIGMSLYPYWDIKAGLEIDYKGTIEHCVANVKALNKKYGCELMLVEAGVEAAKPIEGKRIMAEMIEAMMTQTDGHCHGVFYWAPEAEGYYPLGAFKDHKPTAIMEAFTEASLLR